MKKLYINYFFSKFNWIFSDIQLTELGMNFWEYLLNYALEHNYECGVSSHIQKTPFKSFNKNNILNVRNYYKPGSLNRFYIKLN